MTFDDIYFDLDGTLLDTAEDIRFCMKQALEVSEENCVAFERAFRIGPPLPEIVRECLPNESENRIQGIIERFKTLYDASDYPFTRSYEGISELLQTLKVSGHRLFIATNKRMVPTLRLVRHFGWQALFSDFFSADMQAERLSKTQMLQIGLEKWRGMASSSVMIGDTSGDIAGGKAASFRTIAVAWGYAATAELQAAQADFICKDVETLKMILVQ